MGAAQDFMGVTCLMVSLPIVLFLSTYCTGHVSEHARVTLALVICLNQFVAATFSFIGDYWFPATTKEATPLESEEVIPVIDGKQKLAGWQKMLIFNRIDVVWATCTVVFFTSMNLFLVIYSGNPWFYAPLFPLLPVALWLKTMGATRFAEYGDTKDGDTLWWAFIFHGLWHLACLPPFFQVYGLMVDGFVS